LNTPIINDFISDEPKIFSVSEINRLVKKVLTDSFDSVWIKGEISNFIKASSGHWYFTIKDNTSQVRCTMFRGKNNYVNWNVKDGKGIVLDQFGNTNNPKAHYEGTGPEIWRDTNKKVTHFISSMGTTGTIVGTSKFLKEKNKNIQIIGVQPEEGAQIPGIRKWPKEYLPSIFSDDNIDEIVNVSQKNAEETARKLAKNEGIFSGASTGGALFVALQIAKQNPNAHIVSIACDRGDRYL